MSFEIDGKKIETDEEGYLINLDDWNDEVCEALINQHEASGHKPLSETARGLIGYALLIGRRSGMHAEGQLSNAAYAYSRPFAAT